MSTQKTATQTSYGWIKTKDKYRLVFFYNTVRKAHSFRWESFTCAIIWVYDIEDDLDTLQKIISLYML